MSVAHDVAAELIAPGYRAVAHLRRSDLYDVYDAWSLDRECRCVVKILRSERRENGRDRQRLRQEGALLLSLTHPHIVRAYEMRERPFPFLVLEAATGATLARLIEDGPLRLPDLAQLATQLASALGYLHRHGYLHLDLKPSNVACDRGYVRLLDLSIARAPGIASAGVGTARYLSPAQAGGGVLSTATDVWGLGCVLYEALTGSAPFGARRGARAPRDIRAASRLRPATSSVVMRCFRADPAERPSLGEIVNAFARFA